jgi:MFS superfamily sulfate permease-like transporter
LHSGNPARRARRRGAARHPGARTEPGIVVARVESGLFFANADHVGQRLRALVGPAVRAVVLDAETTPFIDVTAAQMLADLVTELRRDGVELVVARDIGQVRDMLRRAAAEATAGPTVYANVDSAVAAARGSGG